MTGFIAFLKTQKITKMWECCLCHLYNPCILIVLCKDLKGQKHKSPQDTLFLFPELSNSAIIFFRQLGRTMKSCIRTELSISMTITTLKFRKFGDILELSKTILAKVIRSFIS